MKSSAMKSSAPWLYAGLAIAGIAWALFSWGGEEARVRKQLGKLQGLIEKTADESQIAGVDKARRLSELFTPDFAVEITPYGHTLSDRASLSRTAVGYRSRSERIGLSFRDETLDVDAERGIAEHDLEAVLTGDGRREAYRLHIQWAKDDGKWRIRRFEVVEILEGTPSVF